MQHYEQQRGVTLIEMVVVVGIISILAAIAYPSYQKQSQRGKRTDAKAALINVAAQQERFFLRNNRYGTLAELGIDGTENEFYQLTVTLDGNTEFEVEAVPAGSSFSGGQWLDTDCLVFRIDQLGRKTAVGDGGADNSNICWQ